MKMNNLQVHATMWTNFINIMLSGKRQSKNIFIFHIKYKTGELICAARSQDNGYPWVGVSNK